MKKAAELVQSVLDSLSINDTKGYSSFLGSWSKIVGLDLSEHCKPADVRRGILLVEVDHPGWLQKFKMQERQFLKEVQTKFSQLGIRRFGFIYVDSAAKRSSLIASRLLEVDPLPTEPSEELIEPQLLSPVEVAAPEASSRADFNLALERLRRAMSNGKP
jgi:hypothetical protein